jgi:hypothetical protein
MIHPHAARLADRQITRAGILARAAAARRQRRALDSIRQAAAGHAATGQRLTAAILAARAAGLGTVPIARAAMTTGGPAGLAQVRESLYLPHPDPDRPVPYALTPLAHAALTAPDAIPPGEWACRACGSAWLGTPPQDELCPGCHPPAPAGAAA